MNQLRNKVLHIFILAGMLAFAFCNALSGPFCLDDVYLIQNNFHLRSIWPISKFFLNPETISSLEHITQYRPMLPLSLAVSYAFSGNSLIGYHVGNLICHFLVTLVVYQLFIELLTHWNKESSPRFYALLGTLVFAVHPVSGFTINYLSLRDLQLMTFFLYASFLVYIRMRLSGKNDFRWILIIFFYLLSLFSKTNAVVLPGVVFLFEVFLMRQKIFAIQLWLKTLPFFLSLFCWFFFKRFVVGFSDFTNAVEGNASMLSYGATQLSVHTFEYLRNFFWPFYIRLMPGEEVWALLDVYMILGLIVVVAPLLYLLKNIKKYPLMGFLCLAYWTILIPSSSIVPLFYKVAHYRPYPAMPCLILFILLVSQRVLSSRNVSTVFVLAICYFTLCSLHLNTYWTTNERIWKRSVDIGGGYLSHLNYAMAIRDKFDPEVRKNLEKAIELSPHAVIPRLNLGLLLIDYGEHDKGLALVQEGVRFGESWGQSHYWLSHAYEKVGKRELALHAAIRAAEISQRRIDYQYRAALFLQYFERFEESLRYLDKVLLMDAQYKEALFMKGYAFHKTGKKEFAEAAYRKYLNIQPGHFQVYVNLALLLKDRGRCEESLPLFQKALSIRKEATYIYFHMSHCYAALENQVQADVFMEKYRNSDRST